MLNTAVCTEVRQGESMKKVYSLVNVTKAKDQDAVQSVRIKVALPFFLCLLKDITFEMDVIKIYLSTFIDDSLPERPNASLNQGFVLDS